MEKLFESQQVLALFMTFLVPGFISLKVYDLFIPAERRDFSKSLYDAVAYSALNFVALFWLISQMRSGTMSPITWYLSFFLVVIGAPAIWPILFLWLRRQAWMSKHVPHANSRVWDDVFSKREEYWVIVHLKDRRIGGKYRARSFASSNPAQPEIYIEEVWKLDEETGRFLNAVEQTAGVLILGDEILAVEFFLYS
jgi:Family of unknown function (DUF6338)